MKYFLKFICQFVSFFLVFAIGFLSCIAVVVGGAAYAYCNISIDKLNDWGVGIDTSTIFDPTAEVPADSLTLQTLIGELLGIAGKTDRYSLQDLVERYGLIIPEEVAKYLPSEVILDTALDTLFSAQGLEVVLKNTDINYFLNFVPEGLIAQEVYDTIGEKSLYEVIYPEGNDYSAALKGVQLGFFLGVTYEKDAQGHFNVVKQGEYPTLLEMLAPIDFGTILGIVTNGESVPNAVYQCLGHIDFVDVVALFANNPAETLGDFYDVLKGRGIGSLFADENSDGIYELYVPGLFDELYLGMLLGIDGELTEEGYRVNFADADHPTILELLAPISIGGIVSALFDEEGDVISASYATIGDLEFNDLFGTFLNLEKLGMTAALEGKRVKDMIAYENGNFVLKLPSLFDGVYLGDFLGVEYSVDVNGNFIISENDDSHPAVKLVAHINIGDIVFALFNSGSDIIGTVYDQLAEILFLDVLNLFFDTAKIPGLDAALENKSIGTVFTYDKTTKRFGVDIPAFFDDIYVADFLDVPYHIEENGAFVLDTAAQTWKEVIAHICISDFVSSLFAENGDILGAVYDNLSGISFSEILNIFFDTSKITGLDKALEGKTLGTVITYNKETRRFGQNLPALFEGFYLADFLGVPYHLDEDGAFVLDSHEGTWKEIIAHIGVAEFVSAIFEKNGDILGTVYDVLSVVSFSEIINLFFDTSKVTGLDKALEGKTFGTIVTYNRETHQFGFDLPALFAGFYLADFFGVPYHTDESGAFVLDVKKVTTFAELFAHVSVYDLVDAAFNGDVVNVLYRLFKDIRFDTIFDDILALNKDGQLIYPYLYQNWKIGDFVKYDTVAGFSFDTETYVNALDIDRLIGEFTDGDFSTADLIAAGTLAAGAIGYVLFLLFFNDKPILEFLSDKFGSKTLQDIAKDAVDTGAFRLDRLLSSIAVDDIIIRDAVSGKCTFDWYGIVKYIAFDDIIYIFADYEASGIEGIFNDATIGDLLARDENGNFEFRPLEILGFIYIDDLLDFILSFFGSNLTTLGLDGIFTDVLIEELVEVDGATVSLHPTLITNNLEMNAEFEKIKENPLAIRSLVLLTLGVGSFVVKFLTEPDAFYGFELDLLVDTFLPESEEAHRLFDGTKIGDFYNPGSSDILLTLYNGVDHMVISDILNLTLSLIGKDLADIELDGIFDVKIGELLSHEEDGKYSYHPSAIAAVIAENRTLRNEFDTVLANPLAVRSIVLVTVGVLSVAYKMFFDTENFCNIDFTTVLDRCHIKNPYIREALDGKKCSDFVHLENGEMVFTPVAFMESVKFSSILHFLKISNPYILTIAGNTTFGDIISVDENGDYSFTPFAFLERIYLSDLLGLAKVQNEHALALVSDKQIYDLIKYNEETREITVAFDDFFGDMKFSDLVGIIYETAGTPLGKILGEKTVGDLVTISSAFDVILTPKKIIDDILFTDLFDLAKLGNYINLSILFEDKTVGELLDDPFMFIGDMKVNDILFLAKIKNEKVLNLLDGITLGDLVTMNAAGTIELGIIDVLLGFVLCDIIDIFYTTEGTALADVLKEKKLVDLVQITYNGSFSFGFTPVAFISDILINDLIRLFRLDQIVDTNGIFTDDAKMGDLLYYDAENELQIAWLNFISGIQFITIFEKFNLTNQYVSIVFNEKTIGDLLSYNEEGRLVCTWDTFLGGIEFGDLVRAFGYNNDYVNRMLGEKKISDIIYKSENETHFDPFALTDDIALNDILGIFNTTNENVLNLLDGITFGDLVTMNAAGAIELGIIDVLLGFVLCDIIDIFYTTEGIEIEALLGDKTLGTLIQVSDDFTVNLDIDAFVGDMKFADLVGIVYSNEKVNNLLGDRTVGDLYNTTEGLTWVPFISGITFKSILDLFVTEENEYINSIVGTKIIGQMVYYNAENVLTIDPLAVLDDVRFSDILNYFMLDAKIVAILGDRTVGDLYNTTEGLTLYNFISGIVISSLLEAFGIRNELIDIVFGSTKTIGTVIVKNADKTLCFSLSGLFASIVINDLGDFVLGLAGRSLAGLDLDYIFDGKTIGDLFFDAQGNFSINTAAILECVDFGRIVDTIKANPFSETSLAYIAVGILGAGFLFLTQRDKVVHYDFKQLLNRAGIENTHIHALLDGKCLGDLVDMSKSGLDMLTWYEFTADMKFADMLGVLKKTDDVKLNAIFTTKTVSDFISNKTATSNYKIRIEHFFSDVTLGSLLGEENAFTTALSSAPISDLYLLATGGEGAMTLFELLYIYAGETLMTDLLGETVTSNEILNSILSGKKVSDLIEYNTDNAKYGFKTSFLNGIYVGHFLKYTKGDLLENSTTKYQWFTNAEKTERVSTLNNVLSNICIGSIINDSDNFSFTDVLGDLYVGDLMEGYIKGEAIDSPATKYHWYKDANNDGVNTPDEEVTGIMGSLANVKVSTLTDGNDIDFLGIFGDVTVGEVMGYKMVDGVWYESYTSPTDNTPASNIVNAIADFKLDGLDTQLGTLKIGKVIGYTQHGTVWYSEYSDDENPANDVEATGILAVFADLTINELGDSALVSSKLKTAKVSDALGMTCVGGVWYTEYTDDGIDNDTEAPGIIASLANTPIGDIEDGINSIKLGTVFGYKNPGDGNVWYSVYSDDGDDTNDVKATGVQAALSNSTIDSVSTDLEGMELGKVFGYTKVGTVWYSEYSDDENTANDIEATGMMKAFASLKINDMSDSTKISAAVQDVTIADIMGYTYDSDQSRWETSTGASVTGVMSAIAGSKVGEVQTTIDATNLGILLGYTYDETETPARWEDSAGTPITGITKALASTPVSGISSRLETMTIADVFGFSYDNTDARWEDESGNPISGMMTIIGPNTKVSEMNTRVDELFDNDGTDDVTIGQFLTAGILTLTSSQEDYMDQWQTGNESYISAHDPAMVQPGATDWRDLSLQNFFTWFIPTT